MATSDVSHDRRHVTPPPMGDLQVAALGAEHASIRSVTQLAARALEGK